ncbi:MAG: dTMP kinase [Bacilli bacterium]|nr:dTMP kinase [Bacilli bacterium]
MKKGKLIVIEGAVDGIGKSTQYDLLYQRLISEGEKIVKYHFPSYNTIQGKLIEEYLEGKFGKPHDLSPYFINELYATDRAVTWYQELKKYYDEGYIVLLDRYTTSSIIYQSALLDDKKDFINYVEEFEYHKLGIPKPDKVIFLTAPFELVHELRSNRKENEGIENDIHESDTDFMEKVYQNALFVADYLTWDKIICNENDRMRTIEDIHEEIYKKVKEK